jgi:hypothetical protein
VVVPAVVVTPVPVSMEVLDLLDAADFPGDRGAAIQREGLGRGASLTP